MMAGPQWLYQDAAGHFSLTKWKARIDRYDNVNFDAYVKDGTLIGHYLIDEPNDPANWNGQTISGTTLDEMARYSKQKWPNLPTIVRTVSELSGEVGTIPLPGCRLGAVRAAQGRDQQLRREQCRVGQEAGSGTGRRPEPDQGRPEQDEDDREPGQVVGHRLC